MKSESGVSQLGLGGQATIQERHATNLIKLSHLVRTTVKFVDMIPVLEAFNDGEKGVASVVLRRRALSDDGRLACGFTCPVSRY
ncbi:uncharacterized protein V1513DRAFT_452211 [Lipomyces chichibuensis]|uniref:uncharacterized protein n=1 Tax=Lipomyces chichibuensis TaxID=1546026 RepID=UPI003343AC63